MRYFSAVFCKGLEKAIANNMINIFGWPLGHKKNELTLVYLVFLSPKRPPKNIFHIIGSYQPGNRFFQAIAKDGIEKSLKT